jgi:hypothetical protein
MPKSGLLFKPAAERFPPIPQRPNKHDARAALKDIEALIIGFPFKVDADRSVAVSAILTALHRHAIATAPLFAFSSPTPGTGKSLLVDIAAMLATGQRVPVISQGRSEEELEKRLGAALLAGDIAISLDNCEHRLESVFLCQALTQQKLNIRLLGKSKNVETLNTATFFATGNNLVIAGDLTRRALLCRMDAKVERPELRTFDHDALKDAQANRGELVIAALTVLRAFQLTNEPVTVGSFGSFEDWSQQIRKPLVWLDRADPCNTIAAIRENDPGREGLAAVVMQWSTKLDPKAAYTVQQVIQRAVDVTDFRGALLAVAADRSGNFISSDRLGRWLKRVEGRITNGFRLLNDGTHCGYPLWKLTST